MPAITPSPAFTAAARSSAPGAPPQGASSARGLVGLDRPYILYPARLEHPRENHLRLLRAYAGSRAHETHVLVLAGADWGAGAVIRAEIARSALSARVNLLGYVPEDTTSALIADADVVVLAGRWDRGGRLLLQALAAGRPTVTNAADIVGDLGALFDPVDEASLTAALDRAVEDHELRARALHGGPDRVRALLGVP